MYDSGKIIAGLIIFFGIFTFPLWYNVSSGSGAEQPKIILPADSSITECVQSVEFMRASHMDLLNDWRNKVVRENERTYNSPNGRKFEMSLTKTCLNCHSNKSEFCDRCHNYLDVDPYCWDCHVEPEQKGSN